MYRVDSYKSKIVAHVRPLRKTMLHRSLTYLDDALGVPPCDRENLTIVSRISESIGLLNGLLASAKFCVVVSLRPLEESLNAFEFHKIRSPSIFRALASGMPSTSIQRPGIQRAR